VPSIPPDRKTIVENNTLDVAVAARIRLSFTKRKAIATVANTSKKPSTQR
jgi:hypothetical protein